jgi:hypothetical protein
MAFSPLFQKMQIVAIPVFVVMMSSHFFLARALYSNSFSGFKMRSLRRYLAEEAISAENLINTIKRSKVKKILESGEAVVGTKVLVKG